MPKVASDSIAKGLDTNTVSFYHFFTPNTTKKLIFLNKHLFKFTFVRHPLDRFISAYSWAVRDNICKFKYPEDYNQKMIILECEGINDFCSKLDSMLSSPKNHLIHFYPQSVFLYNKDSLLFDFIGKYENMDEDIIKLKNEHSINLKFEFGANSKNRKKQLVESLNSKIAELGLTPTSIRKLEKTYANDFKLLNY